MGRKFARKSVTSGNGTGETDFFDDLLGERKEATPHGIRRAAGGLPPGRAQRGLAVFRRPPGGRGLALPGLGAHGPAGLRGGGVQRLGRRGRPHGGGGRHLGGLGLRAGGGAALQVRGLGPGRAAPLQDGPLRLLGGGPSRDGGAADGGERLPLGGRALPPGAAGGLRRAAEHL